MGNAHSTVPKEGLGHPELFYKGVKAAKEGRFTVSELDFIQALKEHRGAVFWDSLVSAVQQKPVFAKTDGFDGTSPREGDDEKQQPASGQSESGSPQSGQAAASRRSSAFHDAAAEAASPAKEGDSGSGHGSDGAEKDVAKPNAALLFQELKVDDIFLPLNDDLQAILDYYRLLADMAFTYLSLLPTGKCAERVRGLAARYCLATISHTQMLLHSLTLWKEEKFGDGGGLIDYAGTRRVHLGSDELQKGSGASDTASQVSTDSAKTGRQTVDRTTAQLVTLALVEENCRFYFLTFTLNYTFLLTQSLEEMGESRKRGRVWGNLQEHLDVLNRTMWDVAMEYPEEYISKLMMAHIPKPASGERDLLSSAGGSSHLSSHQSLSLQGDPHRHLYASARPWSPTQSALMPLIVARKVRLCVHGHSSLNARTKLLSPAQRMSYHYVDWFVKTAFQALPGRSLYMLERALPSFVPGKGTVALRTQMQRKIDVAAEKARREADAAALTDGEAGVHVQVTPDSGVATPHTRRPVHPNDDKFIKKCNEKLRQSERHVNTDLNLSDPHTTVVLCLDEVAALSHIFMVLTAQILEKSGLPEQAALWINGLLEMARGLYGDDSAEMHLGFHSLREGARACIT